jgi:hypothetical protein
VTDIDRNRGAAFVQPSRDRATQAAGGTSGDGDPAGEVLWNGGNRRDAASICCLAPIRHWWAAARVAPNRPSPFLEIVKNVKRAAAVGSVGRCMVDCAPGM